VRRSLFGWRQLGLVEVEADHPSAVAAGTTNRPVTPFSGHRPMVSPSQQRFQYASGPTRLWRSPRPSAHTRRPMANQGWSPSNGGPFQATRANVAMLREEAAGLLRAAAADPLRAEMYRKRAAQVDRMADRLERSLDDR